MKFIRAKSISYGPVRPYENVKAIVIHYTGISNDSAENEANYFAHGNTRAAGAQHHHTIMEILVRQAIYHHI